MQVIFSEKNHLFLVTNQNKFERDKNPSLDQKGNVCCLFGVIMWQKGNVGCLFREKSYFLSEKSKSFWTQQIEFLFKKASGRLRRAKECVYICILAHRLPSPIQSAYFPKSSLPALAWPLTRKPLLAGEGVGWAGVQNLISDFKPPH